MRGSDSDGGAQKRPEQRRQQIARQQGVATTGRRPEFNHYFLTFRLTFALWRRIMLLCSGGFSVENARSERPVRPAHRRGYPFGDVWRVNALSTPYTVRSSKRDTPDPVKRAEEAQAAKQFEDTLIKAASLSTSLLPAKTVMPGSLKSAENTVDSVRCVRDAPFGRLRGARWLCHSSLCGAATLLASSFLASAPLACL